MRVYFSKMILTFIYLFVYLFLYDVSVYVPQVLLDDQLSRIRAAAAARIRNGPGNCDRNYDLNAQVC